ncbi:MAG TPA: ABC transporter permease [Chitinophagaceae bacterium]|nr:ABC transporter permease [Chitinophagaceae bacterium]
MLKNFFKVAWRNLWKNKTSTAINIIGLSTGLICFILIFLFVQDERSYDSFHKNPDQVYRVVKDFVNDDGSHIPDATTPPAMATFMQKDLPEVAQVTRLFPSWGRRYTLQAGDKKFLETGLMRVDSNFFEVFTFPFIKGDKQTALREVRSIILTESSAKKYFGDKDPVGQTIRIDIDNGKDYAVTGVLKDIPFNSHFRFDFLIPLKFSGGDINNEWGWYNFYTYVRLKDASSHASFEKKLQPLFKKYQPDNTNQFYSQALTTIHLDSRLKWELSANGDRSYVRIMMAVAIFVIVIAGINYVNLATARSAKRAKEVGIRKVTGAYKSLLVGQFLSESLLTVLFSLAVSIILASLLLPFFNQVMDKKLTLFSDGNSAAWSVIAGVALFTGLAAGLYPAFYLARFQPVQVLKSHVVNVSKGAFLRKGLVTFQFIISIAMITSIIVISHQLNYIRNKKLGYDKDNILMLQNIGRVPNKEALKEEIKKIPAVKNVGAADGVLGGQNWTNGIRARDREDETLLNFLNVDYDFLTTMNVTFKEGRNFSKQFGRDSTAIILTETAVKEMSLKEPVVGSQIVWGEEDTTIFFADVIGVVKDFHFSSFREPIKPFGFVLDGQQNSRVNTLFIKLGTGNTDETIARVEAAWKKVLPDQPLEYTFQDEQLNLLHRSEMKFEKMFSYLTGLAIIIACLGLFGLSSFMAEQRTREIGIRKVLGATVQGLVTLLSKDFIKLVLIAIVIASFLAWYFMNQWLQDFVYRVKIDWWVFLLGGIAALLIALLTVSFHAVKTAIANPVKSLRTE